MLFDWIKVKGGSCDSRPSEEYSNAQNALLSLTVFYQKLRFLCPKRAIKSVYRVILRGKSAKIHQNSTITANLPDAIVSTIATVDLHL